MTDVEPIKKSNKGNSKQESLPADCEQQHCFKNVQLTSSDAWEDMFEKCIVWEFSLPTCILNYIADVTSYCQKTWLQAL